MKISNINILSPATSAAIPYTSPSFYVGSITDFSVQLIYTTTNLTAKIQVSNDQGTPQGQSFTAEGVVNWTDMTGSAVTDSSSGNIMYDVAECSYRWMRVVITGNGTLTSARINLKSEA